MTSVLDRISLVDVDTHLPEPPDLWTSRLPRAWGDMVPHTELDEAQGIEYWVVGGKRLMPVALFAYTGWTDYPPGHPPRWQDAQPYTWDAKARLELMDQYGIQTQLLYPNVALFGASAIQRAQEQEKILALVRAYNDYQTDWASAAPDRLIPMTSLPFWDIEATVVEMKRCKEAGHRGVVFTQEPGNFGLPPLMDRHWDRLWAAAQEMEISINFHVASGGETAVNQDIFGGGKDAAGRANLVSGVMSRANSVTLAKLIGGGICHRFPRLNFVSVESDIGWVPYLLEFLDWQWKDFGIGVRRPEFELIPSEYFKRQIYGMFCFERAGARWAIERLGADNIMWETDFPHPGSMFPGPTTAGVPAREFLEDFADLGEETLRKIMHDNAAKLYHL